MLGVNLLDLVKHYKNYFCIYLLHNDDQAGSFLTYLYEKSKGLGERGACIEPRKELLLWQSQTCADHSLGGAWQQPGEPQLGRSELSIKLLNQGSGLLPAAALRFVEFSSGIWESCWVCFVFLLQKFSTVHLLNFDNLYVLRSSENRLKSLSQKLF